MMFFVMFIVGVVLAAVVMFFWGGFCWNVLARQYKPIEPLPNDNLVYKALREAVGQSGCYTLPVLPTLRDPSLPASANNDPEFLKRFSEGPVAQLFIRVPGGKPFDKKIFRNGFIHLLVVSLLLGLILVWVKSSLPSFIERFLFIFSLGSFASLFIDGTNPIWFFHSRKFMIWQVSFNVSMIALGGLVLAAFIG